MVVLTRSFLLLVATNSANNSVLLPYDAILGALSVALSLSSPVLGFALSVLVTARGLPRFGAGHVADGLDGVALHGVVLTSGLAGDATSVSAGAQRSGKRRDNVLGLAAVVGRHYGGWINENAKVVELVVW